jgi:hypothetical protein
MQLNRGSPTCPSVPERRGVALAARSSSPSTHPLNPQVNGLLDRLRASAAAAAQRAEALQLATGGLSLPGMEALGPSPRELAAAVADDTATVGREGEALVVWRLDSSVTLSLQCTARYITL